MGLLVSVIIPVYKHERYVTECLESIFAQDYEDIEIIAIDDGSPDSSYEVVSEVCSRKKYRSRFSRVVFVKNPENIGAANTINRGLSLAKGAYLTICNSDDYYEKNRISSLVRELDPSHQMVISQVIPVNSQSEVVLDDPAAFALCAYRPSERFESIYVDLLTRNVAVSSGNLFFSRAVYERIGDFIDLKYCHDWDYVLRASLVSGVKWTASSNYCYRFHSGNSFSSLGKIAAFETGVVYESLLNFFLQTNHSSGVLINNLLS